MRKRVVLFSLVDSIFMREVVLPGFQVVDKLVFSSKTASLDAARAATEVAEIMRWVVVNIPPVPLKVTSADVPLFAAGPVTDMRAFSYGRTNCMLGTFTSRLRLWWFCPLIHGLVRAGLT